MQKALLSLIIVLTLLTRAHAQNDNPCYQDWGKWFTVYSFAPVVDLQISYKYQIKGRKGGDCGQSCYRFSKPIIKKGAHIEFKFDYRKKDGTIGTESFSFVELNKVGISEDNNANFYQGYEMVRIYDAKLVDPERDKSVQLKTDINTAVQNYDQQYNEANTALGKVQDATKRNSLQTRLTNSRNSLLQNKAQAQQQLNSGDGDAMSQTLASIKQNRDDLKTIGLDIDFANKKLPTETKIPAPIKNNGTSDATGRRADNTGNGSQSQSVALTNGGTANAQKRQYQQQANNYLNAANNNNSNDIQKATDLSMAKISATAAGNTAQVQQINAMENQQMQDNIGTIVNLAGALLMNSKTAEQRNAEKLKKLNREIQAYDDAQAEIAVRDSMFTIRVADSVLKIAQFADQDIKLLANEKDNHKILDLLSRICVRFMRITYLRSRTRTELESPIFKDSNYNLQTECRDDQHFDVYHLPDYYGSGFVEGGVKTPGLHTAATMNIGPRAEWYWNTKKSPEKYMSNTDPAYRELAWNYSVAFANLRYVGSNSKEREKFKKDYTTAWQYLQKVANNREVIEKKRGNTDVAIMRMMAYELQGEIMCDSANITSQSVYLDKAFDKIKQGLFFGIENEFNSTTLGWSQHVTILPTLSGGRGLDRYPHAFINSYINLLIITDKILASTDFDEQKKAAYVKECLKVLSKYLATA